MNVRWHIYKWRVWLREIFSLSGGLAFLEALGIVFCPLWIYQLRDPNLSISLWWIVVIATIAFIYVAARRRPRLAIIHQVDGYDVSIEIAVVDIMTLDGDLIIGGNTTFDTELHKIIDPKSIQGLFTQRYYRDHIQVDTEISNQLDRTKGASLDGCRKGKSLRWPVGTCVTLRPKDRTAYLVAIADINENGVASGKVEDLKVALAMLWEYVRKKGSKGGLVVPVLGSGFSRLKMKRDEIVREIIKSFVAACSESTFADKLTIAIRPDDLLSHSISLDELGSFLSYQCKYHEPTSHRKDDIGTPVGGAFPTATIPAGVPSDSDRPRPLATVIEPTTSNN